MLAEYADDGVKAGGDIDFFADGVFTIHEKLLGGVMPQHANRCMILIFLIGMHAACLQREIRYLGYLRGVADQNCTCHFSSLYFTLTSPTPNCFV